MTMTTLQQMVYQDAYKRLIDHDYYLTFDLSVHDLSLPGDKEIKENGYEGAVEQVYQQMVALGQPA
jgi:hypothetical protein